MSATTSPYSADVPRLLPGMTQVFRQRFRLASCLTSTATESDLVAQTGKREQKEAWCPRPPRAASRTRTNCPAARPGRAVGREAVGREWSQPPQPQAPPQHPAADRPSGAAALAAGPPRRPWTAASPCHRDPAGSVHGADDSPSGGCAQTCRRRRGSGTRSVASALLSPAPDPPTHPVITRRLYPGRGPRVIPRPLRRGSRPRFRLPARSDRSRSPARRNRWAMASVTGAGSTVTVGTISSSCSSTACRGSATPWRR